MMTVAALWLLAVQAPPDKSDDITIVTLRYL